MGDGPQLTRAATRPTSATRLPPGPGLLRQPFAARSRQTVGLGVDTANPTGAPALYARRGMGVHYAVDTWETVLS
ncbi:hypothetical protein GCM10018780_26880 [Streptomyces lanatus]|nr:hypothetical protein GCM10018780_26880 [Streptomyces lanatus]